jgi:enoyl-CoA hydratase
LSAVHVVGTDTLVDALRSPAALAALAPEPGQGGAVVVDLRAGAPVPDLTPLAALPVVVVALVAHPGTSPTARRDGDPDPAEAAAGADGPAGPADVVVTSEAAAEAVVEGVERAPIAATALALHLRASAALGIEDALVAESATYSLLQAGPEHEAWLRGREDRPQTTPDDGLRARTERDGDALAITLARPAVRNAVDAAMQQALVDALAVAAEDDVRHVTIAGEGPTFSTGGDLREFGKRPDPATAHLIRLGRSPARSLAAVAHKTTVTVHGPCFGAGVELPAFAGHVRAHPDTTFTLPEVAMGLVPGAGGTVSLPRRIGRHRTAWLGLTGHALDAATALAWGLVDEVTAEA